MKHALYAAQCLYKSNVTPERLKDQSPGSCTPSDPCDGIPVLTKGPRGQAVVCGLWFVGILGLVLFCSSLLWKMGRSILPHRYAGGLRFACIPFRGTVLSTCRSRALRTWIIRRISGTQVRFKLKFNNDNNLHYSDQLDYGVLRTKYPYMLSNRQE